MVNILLNQFEDKLSSHPDPLRPGIVHRLDKDTTGVMIIPFNEYAHWKIADQFKNRTIQKEYIALTWGEWADDEGMIENKLSRSKKNPLKYQSSMEGRVATSKFKLINKGKYFSAINFFPKTGRTHQIRVHSAGNNNPIFGDEKYGGGRNKAKGYIPEVSKRLIKSILDFDRHALHAKKITFVHPESGSELSVDAPIPKDILFLQKQIKMIKE